MTYRLLPLLLILLSTSLAAQTQQRRVPAEWESIDSVWLQWPKNWESSMRPEMAAVIDAIEDFETVHIIVANGNARSAAQSFLANRGVPQTNLVWHIASYDWAWLRDNGPIWIEVNGQTVAQDFGFDGWGGLVPFANRDDQVPCIIANLSGVPCEDQNAIVYERGSIEFNGSDTLIASWPVFVDRNPGVSQASATASFQAAFGVTNVIWLYASPPDDLTKGHVDGICRFIDPTTVVVARFVDQSDPNAIHYEQSAQILAAAGLNVLRMDIPGYVNYYGISMYCVYVNWLVVDGAVVMSGFGVPSWDQAAVASVQGYFPGRQVRIVNTLETWSWGGGVHCITNDVPQIQSVSPIEGSRLGSPPNPDVLLGGVLPPAIGNLWDPVIDHTSFLPGAATDYLIGSATAANVALGSFGTLLVDVSQPPFVIAGPAGQAFNFPLPNTLSLIGTQFSIQGLSIDASQVRFTNALDVTIGY